MGLITSLALGGAFLAGRALGGRGRRQQEAGQQTQQPETTPTNLLTDTPNPPDATAAASAAVSASREVARTTRSRARGSSLRGRNALLTGQRSHANNTSPILKGKSASGLLTEKVPGGGIIGGITRGGTRPLGQLGHV